MSEYTKVDVMWQSGNYIFMEGVNDESCLRAINFIQYHNMNESKLEELNKDELLVVGITTWSYKSINNNLEVEVPAYVVLNSGFLF